MNKAEEGNMLFIIMIAIVLIGLLSVAIRGNGSDSNIDREDYIIKASQVMQYGTELEQAVATILHNGVSESDLRFAHPDAPSYGDITSSPERQVFAPEGGGAERREPPKGVNDGTSWQFNAEYIYPQVGSSRGDLVAILPNVDKAFCDVVNERIGYDTSSTYPADDGGLCPYSGASTPFTGTFAASTGFDNATFSIKPALRGCFSCGGGTSYHFFHVLLAR